MSNSNLHITDIRCLGWKCFDDAQLDRLRDVNVLIGQNNVGKSALLLPLRRMTRLASECVPLLGSPDGAATFGHHHSYRTYEGDVTDGADEGQVEIRVSAQDARFALAEDFPYIRHVKNPGAVNLHLVLGTGKHPEISLTRDSYTELLSTFDEVFEPSNHPEYEGSSASAVSSRCGKAIALALGERIVYVPHEREIHISLEEDSFMRYEERRFSGRDALRRLAQWRLTENEPAISRVEDFVSRVLGITVKIRPSLQPAIELACGNQRWRNLNQLGAGLSQLVIVGIATQLAPDPIILLEEPEISLHPRLQRNLLRILPEFSAQVFITTHSNNLVDSVGRDVQLYHVRAADGGRSTVTPLDTRAIEALRDIGARPSSLAQANAVLWVEGPSDAIYLRYWLLERSDFIEGNDFVFAFHSGALLTHTGELRDPRFLSVISEINPNYFLVLDRDPNEEGQPRHAYAKPWLTHDRAWITEPKEIEGYISDEAMLAALGGESTAGRDAELEARSDTAQSLKSRLRQLQLPQSWSERKVVLARRVVGLHQAEIANPEHAQNLRENLTRVVQFLSTCRDSGGVPQVLDASESVSSLSLVEK